MLDHLPEPDRQQVAYWMERLPRSASNFILPQPSLPQIRKTKKVVILSKNHPAPCEPGAGKSMAGARPKQPISYMTCMEIAACLVGVKLADVKSKCRQRAMTDARQLFFWLATLHCGLSVAGAGRAAGRDHTTALHGARKVAADPRFEAWRAQAAVLADKIIAEKQEAMNVCADKEE